MTDIDLLNRLKPKVGMGLILYGVLVDDIVTMLSDVEKTHKWNNDYFNKVELVIDKIKNYGS